MYFIVDFEDGPQVVRGSWVTKDRLYCAWSPEFETMSTLGYDKIVQDVTCFPDDSWKLHKILRIRAYGDNFSKIRPKLRDAEHLSQTDINTAPEHNDVDVDGRRRSRRKVRSLSSGSDSDNGDDRRSLTEMSKYSLPAVPSLMMAPPLDITFADYQKKGGVKVTDTGHSGNSKNGNSGSSCSKSLFTFHKKGSWRNGSQNEKDPSKQSTDGRSRSSKKDYATNDYSTKRDKPVSDHERPRSPSHKNEIGQSGSHKKKDPSKQSTDGMSRSSKKDSATSHHSTKEDNPVSDHERPCSPSHMNEFGQNGSHEKKDPSKQSTDGRSRSSMKDNATSDHSTVEDNSVGHSDSRDARGSPTLRSLSELSDDGLNKEVHEHNDLRGQPSPTYHENANYQDSPYNDNQNRAEEKSLETHTKVDAEPQSLNKTQTPTSQFKEKAFEMADKLSNREFKAYLIMSLHQMQSSVNQITRRMAILEVKSTGSRTELQEFHQEEEEDPLDGLPTSDPAFFNDFNAKLDNKQFASRVVAKLRDLCADATELDDYVRKVLAHILTNELASTYSFKGARGKKKFIDTKLMKVVTWMVGSKKSKDHRKFSKKPTEKALHQTIKDWLRLASQREGGINFKKYRSPELKEGGEQKGDKSNQKGSEQKGDKSNQRGSEQKGDKSNQKGSEQKGDQSSSRRKRKQPTPRKVIQSPVPKRFRPSSRHTPPSKPLPGIKGKKQLFSEDEPVLVDSSDMSSAEWSGNESTANESQSGFEVDEASDSDRGRY